MTRLTADLASGVRRLEEQRDQPWLVMAAAISVAVFIGLLVSQMLGPSPNDGTIGLPDANASVAPEASAATRPVGLVDLGDEADPSASPSPSAGADSDEAGPLGSDGIGAAGGSVEGTASGLGLVFTPGVPGAPSIPGLEPGAPPGVGPTPPPGTAPTPPPGTAPTPPPTTPPVASQPPAPTPPPPTPQPPPPTPEPPPPPTPEPPPPPTPEPPPPTPDADGDGVPDASDECPNEPPGLLPDPLRPGCPLLPIP